MAIYWGHTLVALAYDLTKWAVIPFHPHPHHPRRYRRRLSALDSTRPSPPCAYRASPTTHASAHGLLTPAADKFLRGFYLHEHKPCCLGGIPTGHSDKRFFACSDIHVEEAHRHEREHPALPLHFGYGEGVGLHSPRIWIPRAWWYWRGRPGVGRWAQGENERPAVGELVYNNGLTPLYVTDNPLVRRFEDVSTRYIAEQILQAFIFTGGLKVSKDIVACFTKNYDNTCIGQVKRDQLLTA
ncbi:hypothetical protein BJY52DRAFT_1359220 [Lactarius psammicola]|nr:hypothetical protein BJY52DRAFT_1359220 [Lactarius psammicola]